MMHFPPRYMNEIDECTQMAASITSSLAYGMDPDDWSLFHYLLLTFIEGGDTSYFHVLTI